jgi:hypothetical protein
MNHAINNVEKIIRGYILLWRRVCKWETQWEAIRIIFKLTICDSESRADFDGVPGFWKAKFE